MGVAVLDFDDYFLRAEAPARAPAPRQEPAVS